MPGSISWLPTSELLSCPSRQSGARSSLPFPCSHRRTDLTPSPHFIRVSRTSNSRRVLSSCLTRASCGVLQLEVVEIKHSVSSLGSSATGSDQRPLRPLSLTFFSLPERRAHLPAHTQVLQQTEFTTTTGCTGRRHNRRARESRAGSCC